MKTTLPICIFYSVMNSSNHPTLSFFFLFSTLNFINPKPEKNSCKKWCAGHRNACIFRSTFKSVSLQLHSSQFQAPLNPKNKRNPTFWANSKQRQTHFPLLVRKPKQILPHEPVIHIYVEQSGDFPWPLFYKCKLHCFSWSKHYQRQNLNPQIQLSIIYWPSLHCNLGLRILLEREWRWILGSLKQCKYSKLMPKHQLHWRNLPWYILLFTYRREKTKRLAIKSDKWKMLLIFPMEKSDHFHAG